MQKRNNIFINVIKENYTFLLLLIFLTVVISIQGCYSYTGTGGTPAPNCCKIKNPALVTQACVYGDLDTSECAAIALQSGSSYELVPQDACADYYGNPDCGTDEFINKIGCYLDDGSGVNRFYPQYNYPDPENPSLASSFCGYGSANLFKCDRGEAVSVDIGGVSQCPSGKYCVSGACTSSCTPRCPYGQTISNCNTICTCTLSLRHVDTVAQIANPRVSIYDNKIVWTDNRNGNDDIYMKNLQTNQETRITTDPNNQQYPAIYENKVVWMDGRDRMGQQIYMKDLSTGVESPVTDSSIRGSSPSRPVIYGNKVVWVDFRNGNFDLYMKDLSTGVESALVVAPYQQLNPAISGNKVVWEDSRSGTSADIYMKDLSTGVESPVTTNSAQQVLPAISGNKVVWMDYRDSPQSQLYPQIYMKDLSTGIESRISPTSTGQIMPKIYGGRIVWYENRMGTNDIYIYDILTRTESQLVTSTGSQQYPDIYGNQVIWQEGISLYSGELKPCQRN